MKKLVLFSLMLAGLATVANAQSRYYAESAKDNYFVSVGVGAQVCVNPDNSEYGLGKAITPAFNLSVGKLINPVWGVRAQVAGFSTKLNTTYGNNGKFVEHKQNYVTLRADGMFNISNAIAGYNPDRVFEGYAFMGPALQFTKAKIGDNDNTKALINGSVGLGGAFNVSKSFAINVEVRGEVAQSPFGDYSNSVADGAVSALVGATYYFGGKKFVKVTNEALLVAANGDIKKYKELLAAEQKDHAATKEALAAEKAKPAQVVEKVVEVPVAGPRAIFFQIGSAKIDAKGNVNIGLAADIMKATPEVKYIVNGYADKATGSVKTNQKLSEKRAKAVYDALVKAGVSESQIEWKGLGGQPNMFDNSRALTRVVVIEKAN